MAVAVGGGAVSLPAAHALVSRNKTARMTNDDLRFFIFHSFLVLIHPGARPSAFNRGMVSIAL
ncbi:hypothetical protein D6833_01430 [Candidatus Parcubacteria bacterium]|nr:MAG: hypothetical protein D6833_01430 [Candidatus Parcubacteria bacterium]